MSTTTEVFIDLLKMAIFGVEKYVLYKAMDYRNSILASLWDFGT